MMGKLKLFARFPMAETLTVTRKIDKNLPIPFYYQIVQVLRDVIRDAGAIPGGEEIPFPSEAELCENFQVNRGTIRHALDMLEREGLIYREKGRGTFLRTRRVEVDLANLCSTTEDLRARGWEPGTRVLDISRVQPSLHIQNALRLPDGDTAWLIYRLRLANGEPISLQRSYIPSTLAPDLGQRDLAGSLYNILNDYYNLKMANASQVIRVRLVTPDEAHLLGIAEGTPVFDFTRTSYEPAGKPIEYLESLWRGDRYDLHVRLRPGY
jgi:GntR family transcriptional regulator